MPIINISEEAHRAIRAAAQHDFNETGRRLPDGTWDVPVKEETLAAMQRVAFPGESLSDAIIRAMANLNRAKAIAKAKEFAQTTEHKSKHKPRKPK